MLQHYWVRGLEKVPDTSDVRDFHDPMGVSLAKMPNRKETDPKETCPPFEAWEYPTLFEIFEPEFFLSKGNAWKNGAETEGKDIHRPLKLGSITCADTKLQPYY